MQELRHLIPVTQSRTITRERTYDSNGENTLKIYDDYPCDRNIGAGRDVIISWSGERTAETGSSAVLEYANPEQKLGVGA